MASSPPPPVHVKERIDLTDKERLIFDLLLRVVCHYNLQMKLRVAGGWVRDKLLGKDCNDIDLAVEEMSGWEFCDKIADYLSRNGEVAKPAAIILCNPDQSKHLETARMQLFDIWIDFVNLRADEGYSDNNRIPSTVKHGLPKEDALRRDLTINSLFYNITTSEVEDLTDRGVTDLKYGKIATPLAPKKTFLDDPLRVLQAIRFGARFGFTLDQELKEAAASAEVKAAFARKISRERIGHEVDLMVSGNEPVKAMTYIYGLSLFFVVFSVPQNFEVTEGLDRRCILNMDAIASLLNLLDCYALSGGERRLTFYSALLLPLHKLTYVASKSKQIPLVDYIFRVSLKLKRDDAKSVSSAKDADTKEVDWEKGLIDIPVASKLRVYAGLLLDDIEGSWRISLLVSTLLYPNSLDAANEKSDILDLDKRKDLFITVENEIVKLGLEEVGLGNLKPLVDGLGIMSALGLSSPSSVVGEWKCKVRWCQLAHPLGTQEECIDWIKGTHSKRVKTE